MKPNNPLNVSFQGSGKNPEFEHEIQKFYEGKGYRFIDRTYARDKSIVTTFMVFVKIEKS